MTCPLHRPAVAAVVLALTFARCDDEGTADCSVRCDCSCGYVGVQFYGPCCYQGDVWEVQYDYPLLPDGCQGCNCYTYRTEECAEGCFRMEGPVGAACGEDLVGESCGNGVVEEWEECDPWAPPACHIAGCATAGSVRCTGQCKLIEGSCVAQREVARNGADEDCDGATDEGAFAECCTNHADDNGDGLVDCNDVTCRASPACSPCRSGPEICWDGCDNDGDCFVDALDDDCPSGPGTCGLASCGADWVEVCEDGCDQDRDGAVDCADRDCLLHSACEHCTAQPEGTVPGTCSNGIDDDCDGQTDSPCDTECPGVDPPAAERCRNSVDDDADTLTDCDDPDCSCDTRCSGVPPETCNNGVDDDGDGNTDLDDPDCPLEC